MLDPVWITFLLAIMAVAGGSVRSRTKSAEQLETFSRQLARHWRKCDPHATLSIDPNSCVQRAGMDR